MSDKRNSNIINLDSARKEKPINARITITDDETGEIIDTLTLPVKLIEAEMMLDVFRESKPVKNGKARFGLINLAIVQQLLHDLTPNAIKILGALITKSTYGGYTCSMTQKELAAELGLSSSRISEGIKALRKKGVIRKSDKMGYLFVINESFIRLGKKPVMIDKNRT